MICTKCDKEMAHCPCSDADDRLHALAYDPEAHVLFKWCRTCDKHYARCRCPVPDFYIIGGGKEIPVRQLTTITGERPAVDLSPASERRH